MNAERLLAHYERIADAPDAIARLRSFVLDLAVRGKLVHQDSKDEPASKLLKKVGIEKTRHGVKHEVSTLAADEAPYNLPQGWSWTRVGELCSKTGSGSTPRGGQAVYKNDGIPFLRSQNVYDDGLRLNDVAYIDPSTHAHMVGTAVKSKDLLLNITGGSMGRCCLVPDKFGEANISQHVAIIRVALPGIEDYLHRLVLSPYFQAFIFSEQTGAGRGGLPKNRLDQIAVALPPLAEQHRIVAKVDELMALCDRLEAARAEREATRDRLAASTLARLNTPDPATFQADARFALNTIQALTTRPDQIKQLRQTILNLAVRGKLVPQDKKDEPASKLLVRIAKEKAQLFKEVRAKHQDLLPAPDLDQAPFELPAGWALGRFPELGVFGRGKSKHRPRNDHALFDGGEHLMIQTGDVARSQGIIKTYTSKYNDFGLSQSFKWPKGTLCITIAANIADSGILSFDACFPDSVVGFIPASMFENARYFEYFVRTAKANLLEFAPATAQKNINLEILTQVLIPLPPLAEQQRIVAKVDALMTICDQMESSLDHTATTRCRLLDALLTESLAPTEIQKMEAAE